MHVLSRALGIGKLVWLAACEAGSWGRTRTYSLCAHAALLGCFTKFLPLPSTQTVSPQLPSLQAGWEKCHDSSMTWSGSYL